MCVFFVRCAPGSLSEDAPPPPRGLAMGQHAFSSRHAHPHPTALARSLPVSVPVWGCKSSRAAQGESNSGERVRSEDEWNIIQEQN